MKPPNRQPLTISNDTQKPDSPPAKARRITPTKLTTLAEVRTELAALYRQTRAGRIDPGDATKMAFILGEIRKIITDTPEAITPPKPVLLNVVFDDRSLTYEKFQQTARELVKAI